MIFFSSMFLNRYGLAASVRISALLGTFGLFFRLLVPYGFKYMLIGQLINAIAAPFIRVIGSTVAQSWFGDKERTLVTTITGTSISFGHLFGFLMVPMYIDEEQQDFEKAKDDFWHYTLDQSVIFALFALPNLIIVKAKPPTPPSASAEKSMYVKHDENLVEFHTEEEKIRKSFMKSFTLIICSFNYW